MFADLVLELVRPLASVASSALPRPGSTLLVVVWPSALVLVTLNGVPMGGSKEVDVGLPAASRTLTTRPVESYSVRLVVTHPVPAPLRVSTWTGLPLTGATPKAFSAS
ncbi:hypothetical protein ACFWWM_07330 [Streptomyces sp. NPDC058682]|uniref:hypothetical protein n=1 Tax=Streptomyces sp. NPDC058682 TaxID=3346596 RepID=UPI0036612AAE